MKDDSQKKLAVLLGILGVCLVLILISCLLIFERKQSLTEWKWREAIENGDILLEEGDYQGAEASYMEAISLIPKRDEEPYVKLTDLYIFLEEYDLALSVIDKGISCLEIHQELDSQRDIVEIIISGDSGLSIPSASLIPSETETDERSGDYVNGDGFTVQSGLAAVVAEGKSIEIYMQGQLNIKLEVPGVLNPIAFNGVELLYAKETADGVFAFCCNDIYDSGETVISLLKNCPQPVGKVGESCFFLYEKNEEKSLYMIQDQNEDPVILAAGVEKAVQYGDSIYFMAGTEESGEYEFFCLDPDGTLTVISDCCRYMETEKEHLYFIEGTFFYEYEPENRIRRILGSLPTEKVQVASVSDNSAVYYTEHELNDSVSRIYYKVDFIQGRESFLLETDAVINVYADESTFYLLNEEQGYFYEVGNNAVLKLKKKFEKEEILYGIYEGFVYVKTGSGPEMTIECYGSVR